MGSHYIDALRDWIGEIDEVSATLETRRQRLGDAPDAPLITADDGFVAQLRTESGASCTLVTASSVYAELGPRVEVYGSRGTALLERDAQLSIARNEEALAPVVVNVANDEDATAHPSRGPLGTWAAAVIDAVRAGRQIAPNFDDGVRCQEVMAAMRASSAAGGSWTPVEREG
jgi:predicted dehydrogenase